MPAAYPGPVHAARTSLRRRAASDSSPPGAKSWGRDGIPASGFRPVGGIADEESKRVYDYVQEARGRRGLLRPVPGEPGVEDGVAELRPPGRQVTGVFTRGRLLRSGSEIGAEEKID